MGKATITRVDNGYIVELTKLDIVDRRPTTTVTIFLTLEEVLTYITKERL